MLGRRLNITQTATMRRMLRMVGRAAGIFFGEGQQRSIRGRRKENKRGKAGMLRQRVMRKAMRNKGSER